MIKIFAFLLSTAASAQTYVAIGDSITTGFAAGVSWTQSFAEQIGADKPKIVAMPGLTTGLMTYQGHLARYASAEIVTILGGANDVCWGLSDQIPANISRIMDKVPTAETLIGNIPNLRNVYNVWRARKSLRCNLAYVGCYRYFAGSEDHRQAVDEKIKLINDQLKSLAETTGAVYVDLYSEQYTDQDISRVDCFHPSPSGQQKIADKFASAYESR